MNSFNIPSGPETDRLVAAACGFGEVHVRRTLVESNASFYQEDPLVIRDGSCYLAGTTGKGWSPSSDLNDAFYAASKAALFEHRALLHDDGVWSVAKMFEVHGEVTEGNIPKDTADGWGAYLPGMGILSRDCSLALAICRAILIQKDPK